MRAYLAFSLAGCAFFALTTMFMVEHIEARLIGKPLAGVAAWAGPRHAGKLSIEMPNGIIFHHGQNIPLSLRNLPDGVQEVTVDGTGLHVFAGRSPTGPYVVVDHDSDFNDIKRAAYAMLALGLLGFLIQSALLGRFMGRRLSAPIMALADAVAASRRALPLLDSNDELGILARAFATHTAELQQLLDRERLFAGDVSHELRTPLTIISGAAEILMMEAHGQTVLYAPAERICRAARDAADSVATLLLLARCPDLIESSRLSVASIARDETARLQPLVEHKPVSLVYAGGTDFSVRAPARLIAAAIGNLIRNACLYTDAGSVTVLLERNTVLIRDTGCGLPATVQAMLNDADDNTPLRCGSEGAGLGLALVKRICRYLNAELAMSTQAANGTVFSITFAPDLTKNLQLPHD